MRWAELDPECRVVGALDHAGAYDEEGSQNEKRRWSEQFADGCAVAIANAFKESDLGSKRILPESLAGGTEPLTPLGSGTSKRIDVTISDSVLGLEVGVSLKGLNFRDRRTRNFDKNVTGRLYELSDEVRLVHEHLPHAFMVGVFFLPLNGASDKVTGPSSFARTVMKLRDRTGRLDPGLAGHAAKCDMTFVGLYSPVTGGDITRGVCRFQDTQILPPKAGRPKVDQTLSLEEMILEIVKAATFSEEDVWADPEEN